MHTNVLTPQAIFVQLQSLIVPLFQRPYVWNQENQWEPLWDDVCRLADRYLADPTREAQPHFLGAVVLQQAQKPTGSLQQRTIIDGQQRLTTLQLLLDALHAELVAAGAGQSAKRLELLVANAEAYCERLEDRFKVWPTNRDRAAFNAVMAATPPVAYDELKDRDARLVKAHRFFSEQARAWLLTAGEEHALKRAEAVEKVVREQLQLVVIDLTADENAQEIFETLNARGAQLTAADLIKNLVFQRIVEEGAPVEEAYDSYWREFETAFWETEISAGRVRQPRVSVFLNHWLTAQTGEEIVAREVFARFKQYVTFDAPMPMADLLKRLHRAAAVYANFAKDALTTTGSLDRRGLFAYRTSVLESEVVKPLILLFLDPEAGAVPEAQLVKAFDVLESWFVRRMLVRATTKSYTQFVAELVAKLRGVDRARLGDALEETLRAQSVNSRYWPDDDDVRTELEGLVAYKRIGKGRLRMLLEAIEDHARGWVGSAKGLGGERVTRGSLAIEHVLPQKWQANWPLGASVGAQERDTLLHTLGNLTLLTGRLNSTVSNGPWDGADGKREALQKHDVLMLNRELLSAAKVGWSDEAIRDRTKTLIASILKIWPVPGGHRSAFANARKAVGRRRVDLTDLIGAGLLEAGATLYARPKKHRPRTSVILQDGRIDVNGQTFTSLSSAAAAISGSPENGWYFFSADPATMKPLLEVWRAYKEQLSVEGDDDEDEDGPEESEA